MHLAAAHGCEDTMKLLLEKQPEKKLECFFSTNNDGRTPLHLAAMFDRGSTVSFLIDEVSKKLTAGAVYELRFMGTFSV